MIREVLNNIYPNWSSEKVDSVSNFLQKQDTSNIERLAMCIRIIDSLYQYCESRFIELVLVFNEKIQIGNKEMSTTITHEQIQELKMVGVDALGATESMLISELVKDIIKEFDTKKVYFSTNEQFFDIEIRNVPESFNKQIVLIVNYKVLTTKDLRKLKLDEIEKR